MENTCLFIFSAVPDDIVLRYDDFSNVILNGYKTYVSCNPDGDGGSCFIFGVIASRPFYASFHENELFHTNVMMRNVMKI